MEWERLQEVFWAARELPLVDREPFLVAECGDDQATLDQLRRMLRADSSNDGVLDRASSHFTPLAQSRDETISGRVGPYIIAEEIGRGGMGVVYRAHDPRLQRDVALKFFTSDHRDEGAQSRYIREARAASALDHPNNCPVYDVGSTDAGHFYIAMAYCAGGSLADRLAAGPLDVDEAVRITMQIADMLDRAHDAGIVHRDIKPANIAFTERADARVLDFGIAAFGEQRDAAPMAGTLAYMSPEQLRGEDIDRRTDVWALAVVLYEMLTGNRPFAAAGRAEVARLIAEAEPANPCTLRRELPPAVARVVRRGLAKDPTQRFQSAGDFAAALRTAVGGPRLRARRIAVLAVIAIATTALLVGRTLQRNVAEGIDASAVAVLPFHVSGDGSLAYLEEGMVDLLAAKLTGEGGLRAADPRSVLSIAGWSKDAADLTQGDAVAVARRAGAGQALIGSIVGSADRMIVNATLVDIRGVVVGRGSAEGTHTSLSLLVDSLVGKLLSLKAGEEPQRLAALTSTSLPALRAYLEGNSAYRRGDYAEAVERFARALDLDSTFALAGLGLDMADGWVGSGHATARGRAVAWRWRERMSMRDRALLEVSAGPSYPAPATITQRMDAADRALRIAPDHPDLWYTLGDLYFHWGRILDVTDWESRAERGFKRALELDTAFAAPRHHLVALYARQRRGSELQAVVQEILQKDRTGATADYARWRHAVTTPNRKASGDAMYDSLATETLGWISMLATDEGIEPAVARRTVQIRSRRPGTREQRLEHILSVHASALNSGQPASALALTDSIRDMQPDSTFHLRLRVFDALYGDGDGVAGKAAALLLARRPSFLDRCVAALWDVHTNQRSRVGSLGLPAQPTIEQRACALGIEALRTRSDAAVARLNEFYRAGPLEFYRGDAHVEFTAILLARILEEKGNRAGALASLRRRPYFMGWQPFLAASLYEEGRLAAATGDRLGAFRAYQHYLTLRSEPEPSLEAKSDSVRSVLRMLTLRQH